MTSYKNQKSLELDYFTSILLSHIQYCNVPKYQKDLIKKVQYSPQTPLVNWDIPVGPEICYSLRVPEKRKTMKAKRCNATNFKYIQTICTAVCAKRV